MSVLKIRGADGKVYEIPTLKGDKGDPGYGVPFDGIEGQVLKKTADGGTEWGNIGSNLVYLDNSRDIMDIGSCEINQRGLYEVGVTIDMGVERVSTKCLVSVSDLGATFEQYIMSKADGSHRYYIHHQSGVITIVNNDADSWPWLTEVRLLIPYG